MTYEEAIEHVKNIKNGGNELQEDYDYSLQLAINALEKATARTPEIIFLASEGDFDMIAAAFMEEELPCPSYGQKIDWWSVSI